MALATGFLCSMIALLLGIEYAAAYRNLENAKIIADQQGHGLGVHLDRYVDSSVARKREAVTALWSDFKALRSEPSASN